VGLITGLVTGLIAVLATVLGTGYLDDQRSDREHIQNERTEWRFTFLSTEDLRNADLSRTDLSGLLIKGKDLRNAVFEGTNLSKVVLANSRIDGARLGAATLTKATVRDVSMQDVDLSAVRTDGANFENVDLSGSDTNSELSVSAPCYSSTTKWEHSPPTLDWQSCWVKDSSQPPRERVRPKPEDCGFGKSDNYLHLYFKDLSLSAAQACAYLGYLSARAIPRENEYLATVGSIVCKNYQESNESSVHDVALMTGYAGDPRGMGEDIVLAAVTWLCPQFKHDAYSEIWPS
jgi:hypothetical protein